MGIARLDCPECGAAATIGVPEGADVSDPAAAASDLPEGGKHRTVACDRGHEVYVQFDPYPDD